MQVHEICDPWAQRRWACGLGVPPLGHSPPSFARSDSCSLVYAQRSTQDTNATPHGARPPFAIP